MRKDHDYHYKYRGLWHDGGRCRIEVYVPEAGEAGRHPVIVAAARDDNAGSSVTNLAALAGMAHVQSDCIYIRTDSLPGGANGAVDTPHAPLLTILAGAPCEDSGCEVQHGDRCLYDIGMRAVGGGPYAENPGIPLARVQALARLGRKSWSTLRPRRARA